MSHWIKATICVNIILLIPLPVAAVPKARAPRQVSVKIELTGGCTLVRSIAAVFEGDEEHSIPRTRIRKDESGYYWTEWVDLREKKFPDEAICASLRLDGTRTYCQLSQWQPGDHDADIAYFSFDCDERPAHHVTIDPQPGIDFSYIRELKRNQKQALDCPCIEQAHSEGRRTVPDLLYPKEKLLLQLGIDAPKPDADGLVLFSSDPKDPGVFTFTSRFALLINDPALRKGSTAIDGGRRIQRKSIIQSLIEKNLKRPLSDRATDIYETTFGAMKYVDVTVTK